MVLHMADVSEIGRYEVGSCGSLFGLSRGVIVLSFQVMGSSPFSHDLFISFKSVKKKKSSVRLVCSLNIHWSRINQRMRDDQIKINFSAFMPLIRHLKNIKQNHHCRRP